MTFKQNDCTAQLYTDQNFYYCLIRYIFIFYGQNMGVEFWNILNKPKTVF